MPQDPRTAASPPSTARPDGAARFSRLLLTGAAGGLGRQLRTRLPRYCQRLRISDIAELGEAAAHEEIVTVPLEDKDAMRRLLEGVDAVVHMGGVSTEQPFEVILPANIVGMHNLYEAARINKVARVVYASSNHAIGFYRRDQHIDTTAPARPDSNYGVSKAFGENLASFYWDRYGIETVALRIGSSYPEPKDRRMLDTWLSYDDLERLVVAALTAPQVGFSVIYGVSDNPRRWWDNAPANHIGYRPKDSAEKFRSAIEGRFPAPDPADPAEIFQGGGYVKLGPFE